METTNIPVGIQGNDPAAVQLQTHKQPDVKRVFVTREEPDALLEGIEVHLNALAKTQASSNLQAGRARQGASEQRARQELQDAHEQQFSSKLQAVCEQQTACEPQPSHEPHGNGGAWGGEGKPSSGIKIIGRAVTRQRSLIDADLARTLRRAEAAWVVLTSKNAVKTLAESTLDLLCGVCAGKKIATVGPGTSHEVRKHGLRVDFEAAGSAAAILAAIDTGDLNLDGGVVLVQAKGAKKALRDGLRARGIAVAHFAIYETEAVRPLPAHLDGRVDAVVVLAGSAVRAIEPFLAEHPHIKIVTIGHPSATCAQNLGLNVAATAQTPDAPGLAAAIWQALNA